MKYTCYMVDGPPFEVEADSEEEAVRKSKEEADRRAQTPLTLGINE